jgi:hypothetical protein
MGMRYDFELAANLREDVPDNIIRILTFLLLPGEVAPDDEPDHPFFSYAWRQHPFSKWATSCDPHTGDAVCSFRRVYRYTKCGIDHHQFTVHLRFADKAETVFEIGLAFAMWLALWSDQDEFVGYLKMESKPHPTLLYYHNRELYLREVAEPPQRATDGAYWD